MNAFLESLYYWIRAEYRVVVISYRRHGLTKKDYYEILGVDRTADAAEIKKVYRGLVRKVHPDVNRDDPEATERMKELNEAYAVLSDERKRQLYDTYGHRGLEGYSEEDIFRGVDFSGLFRDFGQGGPFGFGGSVFDNIFGGRSTRRGPQKGADLRYDLTISLEEAAAGAQKSIRIPEIHECTACKGTGAQEGGLEVCAQCKGTGQMVTEQRRGSSVFREIRTCTACRGKGKIINKPCPQCQGMGLVETTRELALTIPAGADTGHAIKIAGEGEKGRDLPGDLYVIINIEKHRLFERHGADLFTETEIPFTTAALGGTIEVVNLKGEPLKLDIPEGTQTGAILRIEGQGMPRGDGSGDGDEYVGIKVITPTNLTERQKRLLKEFDAPEQA